jgi:DHA1 family bicyclomycin/chloramphenicol resistance-like MFS transporter
MDARCAEVYIATMSTFPDVRFLDRATPPHIVTLILMVGTSALSMNVFLPSLPNMTEYFGTDYRVMQLSVALFLAVNAVLQLVIGPLADRFGRRPVLLWGFGLYLVATLGCIFAPSAEIFLVFRMCQATIVVGMVLSRAIVRDMVPQDEAASMIGWVTMGMAIVPMLGPAIGGVLDQAFGWQANFWLQIVVGLAVTWLIWSDVGETSRARGGSFRSQLDDLPELVRSRRFWGYALAAAFSSGAFFAYLGGAPYVGSDVFGLSPAVLGIFFGAPAIGYAVGNGISGRYSVRYGINSMILWGSMMTFAGMLMSILVFLVFGGSALVFFGFTTFVGLGNGLVLPNATAGMLSVRPHLAGTASGIGGAFMIGGGAGLSALAGWLLRPGTGAWPLLFIMALTSAAAVACILYVIRREREVGLTVPAER